MDETSYALALSVIKGLGPRRVSSLIRHFGSARAAWLASSAELGAALDMTPGACHNIINARTERALEMARDQLFRWRQRNIAAISLLDASYPEMLRHIPDPPPVLFVRGRLPSGTMVAVVGSRRATPYGRKVAENICRDLSEAGVIVVSGLARGVDTSAHEGALAGGGPTVAVLGSGVDVPYPPENVGLMRRVIANGAAVSENLPGTPPESYRFPVRNRIISGLCVAIVVVEAGERSGALITADLALEQGREVMAVPGNITSRQSLGTNRLIKQGAKLVECAGDVLEEIGIRPPEKASGEEGGGELSSDEQVLMMHLSGEPVNLDQLVVRTGLDVSRVSAGLCYLELKGLVKQLPGKKFCSWRLYSRPEGGQ